MARRIARMYRVPVPRIKNRRLGKKKWIAGTFEDGITLNIDRARWSPMLVCHELAHWVADKRDRSMADHGPVWMGVYLYLLAKLRIIPLHATVYSARKFGLDFANPLKCGPEDL